MAKVGIDVSKHNGQVNWDKVKSKIDFAIIRIGHGSDINSQDDPQAINNMNACDRLGIPYGVYLYSYALTEEEAESEAKHMLRMIKGRNIKCGIWFDMEDADDYKNKHNLPLDVNHSELYTRICATFTNYIKENGYKNVGIYSSKYVFENIIGKDYLQYSDIKIWVAQWNSKCTYNGRYDIWQYTSDGSVDGVPSARVDMNYMYTDFNETGTSTTNTKIDTKPVSLNTNVTNGVNVSTKYSVGQKVEVTGYYASSTETNRNKIVKRNTTGTITKIKEGTSNPYLLDNGGLGWCSESDIVRVVEKTEVIYIVKHGDTLSSIAKKYNTTYTKIAKDNGIVNPNIIFTGQKLVIK